MDFNETKNEAWQNYHIEDDKRIIADRRGFTAGFDAAWNIQQKRIAELEAQLAEIQLQYNGIMRTAKYTKNPVMTTGLACAITGKSLFELENEK